MRLFSKQPLTQNLIKILTSMKKTKIIVLSVLGTMLVVSAVVLLVKDNYCHLSSVEDVVNNDFFHQNVEYGGIKFFVDQDWIMLSDSGYTHDDFHRLDSLITLELGPHTYDLSNYPQCFTDSCKDYYFRRYYDLLDDIYDLRFWHTNGEFDYFATFGRFWYGRGSIVIQPVHKLSLFWEDHPELCPI